MIREIVEIDEAKCDGCGECIPSCAEGALYLHGGKVKLRSDAPASGSAIVPQDGSRLGQWPVQLSLVSSAAPWLRGADLLVAADCIPFAYARFHEDFLAGRRVLVGCPKLDDVSAYTAKLEELFRRAGPKSVTVVKMEVPCCGGIAAATRQALARSGAVAPLEVVTIGIAGGVVDRRGG